jgi:hypothetical protein
VYGGDGIDPGDVTVSLNTEPITGGYTAFATVELPDDGSAGTISVKFTNPNSIPAGAYVNVTVVRDSATATTPDNVAQRLYKPDGLGTYYDITGMVVPNTEFGEVSGDTLYAATGLDVLKYSFDTDDNPNPLTNLTDVTTFYTAGFGNYVYSMTIDGTPYAASGDEGWMYGTYRQVGSTATSLDLVEVTPYVGADAYIVSSRDLMIWKYGDLGTYNALFPSQITFP